MIAEEVYGGASNRRDIAINLEDYPEKTYSDYISNIIMSYVKLYKKKYYSYEHAKHFDYTTLL